MVPIMTIVGVCTLIILLSAQQARAVEPLSARELADHCSHYADDPDSRDAIFCMRYPQGFIDGAVATDERIVQNIATEPDTGETFTERVMRTRLGSRTNRFGPTVYTDFCLGAPLPLKVVVEKVVNKLMNRRFLEEQLLSRDAVFSTLRNEYPCKADETGVPGR